jgi:hypothetical protein
MMSSDHHDRLVAQSVNSDPSGAGARARPVRAGPAVMVVPRAATTTPTEPEPVMVTVRVRPVHRSKSDYNDICH